MDTAGAVAAVFAPRHARSWQAHCVVYTLPLLALPLGCHINICGGLKLDMRGLGSKTQHALELQRCAWCVYPVARQSVAQ